MYWFYDSKCDCLHISSIKIVMSCSVNCNVFALPTIAIIIAGIQPTLHTNVLKTWLKFDSRNVVNWNERWCDRAALCERLRIFTSLLRTHVWRKANIQGCLCLGSLFCTHSAARGAHRTHTKFIYAFGVGLNISKHFFEDFLRCGRYWLIYVWIIVKHEWWITKLIGLLCGDSKLWLMRGLSNC